MRPARPALSAPIGQSLRPAGVGRTHRTILATSTEQKKDFATARRIQSLPQAAAMVTGETSEAKEGVHQGNLKSKKKENRFLMKLNNP